MTIQILARRAAFSGAALGAAMALTAGAVRADDQNRHVRIINETEHVMTHFYASNVATNDWQEDILGKDVVPPGQDVDINIDDGTGHCKFDFKAVFDDGQALIRKNVNVCEISSYRYTE